MRKTLLAVVIAVLVPLPALAQNSNLVLHPNGFGEKSFAAWKAHEGLADSGGSADQALYFQKMTSTSTFAAGIAVINGIEGTPVGDLTGLSFWVRQDGHCGAGAPRWNIGVKPESGSPFTVFVGCAGMLPGPTMTAPNGEIYQQRTIALPAGPTYPPLPATGTITGLAIVFDEGTDQGVGFTFLDNITVELNGVARVWTAPRDNGK